MIIATDAPAVGTFHIAPPNAPSETPPSKEPPLIDPPLRMTDVRDDALAFASSNISIDTTRSPLKHMHAKWWKRVDAQPTKELERTRTSEQRAGGELARAHADHHTGVDESEHSDRVERLGRERRMRHGTEVVAWGERAGQRRAHTEQLSAFVTQLSAAERDLRKRTARHTNPWMTRKACGFLSYASYTILGTLGVAVSALLDDSGGRSLLTDVGMSLKSVATRNQSGPRRRNVRPSVH